MELEKDLLEKFTKPSELMLIKHKIAKNIFIFCSFIFFLNIFLAGKEFSTTNIEFEFFLYSITYTYTIFIASLFIYIYFFLIVKIFINKSILLKFLLILILFILFISSLVPFF